MLLAVLFKALIRSGRLTVIDAGGRSHDYGQVDQNTPADEPHVVMRLTDPALHWKLALNPGLVAGEAFMDGTLRVEQGTLYDLLSLFTRNAGLGDYGTASRAVAWIEKSLRLFQQMNPIDRSRRNVAHHYDLSGALYELFLDADKQYSCAYFPTLDTDLETAQLAKKRHIAAKLLLKPGQSVLDIGCGWGGMALFLAKTYGVKVTGITLSQEQLAVAQSRAVQAGMAEQVKFHLRDYRHETGQYDRIVSVGMFEHVGVPQYATLFAQIRNLLADDGVALLHSIGRLDGPGTTNPWLRKYIFPGGYSPALSEVVPVVEQSGLFMTDIEILRLHYAETLRHWRVRFMANRDKAIALYDERFARMWEFYLAACECAFRHQGHIVFQMQLARRVDTVPLTRDYIQTAEVSDLP